METFQVDHDGVHSEFIRRSAKADLQCVSSEPASEKETAGNLIPGPPSSLSLAQPDQHAALSWVYSDPGQQYSLIHNPDPVI